MEEDCKTGKVVKSDLRRSDRVQINRVEHTSCPSQIELCLDLFLRRFKVFCSFWQDYYHFLDHQNKGLYLLLRFHVCPNIPSQNTSARGWICSFAGVCISPPSLVEPAWLRYEIEKRLRAVYTITTISITTTNLIIMSLTDRFVLCRCPQLLSWWETTD